MFKKLSQLLPGDMFQIDREVYVLTETGSAVNLASGKTETFEDVDVVDWGNALLNAGHMCRFELFYK